MSQNMMTPSILRSGDRRYGRRRQYIDVLDVPDIAEAIELATQQLRVGLARAMEATPCDEDGNVIENNATKAKKNKAKPKGPTDSHAIYSALFQPVSKQTQQKIKDIREAKERKSAPASVNNQISRNLPTSAPTPPPALRPGTKSWNSEKKAGPSILTKRPRSEPVVPPPPKPVKRPAPPTMASIASIAANEPIPAPKPPPPQRAPGRSVTVNANASKLAALRAAEAKTRSIDTANYAHIRKAAPRAVPNSKTLFEYKTSTSRSSTNRAPKTPVTALTPLKQDPPVMGKANPSPASRQPSAAQVIARRSVGADLFAAVQNAGAGRALLPMAPSQLTRQARPQPSRVLYPPGLKAIGTVPPNGYEFKAGVLTPVVTKDTKVNPKVPLKLRQTFAEKLFAAWRDNAELEPMVALVKALRTEQTMYAQAAGKIDYRAAALTNLSDAKKGK